MQIDPTDHPLEISDLDSLRTFYRQEAARQGGGIVSVEVVQIRAFQSVKVINKYEEGPGYSYQGQLTIPFRDAHYTLTMDSIERGTTGEREALVTATLAERGELENEPPTSPDSNERIRGWFQDPYDSSYSGQAMYSMSDDDRLDALFPDHPLSKIRACLARTRKSLVIDDAALIAPLPAPAGAKDAQDGNRPRRLLSSPAVASLYLLFSSSLLKAGRFDEGEGLLAGSLSCLEHDAGDNDLLVARHLLLLGLAHDNQGKHLDAERVLSRSWSIFKAKLGDDHPDTAHPMLNLARVYIFLGRHNEAEPLFQQALTVFENVRTQGSNVALALNGLGLVHNARSQYAQALACFERALEIFETTHGPEFVDCATVLRNQAISLQKIGEDRRAEDALERARQIDRQIAGPGER